MCPLKCPVPSAQCPLSANCPRTEMLPQSVCPRRSDPLPGFLSHSSCDASIHSRPSLLVVLLQTSLRTTPGFFINTGCCSTLSFPNLPLPFLAALLRISSATYIPTSIALLSRTVVRHRPHHGLPGLREAVPGGADRDETAICEARIWPEGKEALQSVLVVAFDYFLRHFPDRCAVPVSRKHSMRTVT